MTCQNDPGPGLREQLGVCHVCSIRSRLPAFLAVFVGRAGRTTQAVMFCVHCCHWFCAECWENVFGRFVGFVEQYVRSTPGCCGPREEGESAEV